MDALAWVEIALFGCGIIGSLILIIFRKMSLDVGRMADSMSELNVKMAVVLERQEQHEKRIDRLEQRIEV